MVKIMETPIKIHDLGVYIPLFLVQHPYEIPDLRSTPHPVTVTNEGLVRDSRS